MTRTFSKNSWHYRLSTTYGSKSAHDIPTNICGYIRSVLFGAFIAFMVMLMGTFVIICMVSPLLYLLIDDWYMLSIDHHPEIVIGWCLYVLISIFGLWVLWETKIAPWLDIHKVRLPSNSFISSAVESIHDKTCFPIVFVDSSTKE
jgi:hypothetical protein